MQVLAQPPLPQKPGDTELNRILSLPVIGEYPPAARERVQREYVLANQYALGWRLKATQADAVLAFLEYGTLFGPIGVGKGKTLITLLCCAIGYKLGIKRQVLFIPSDVYTQLVLTDLRFAREHVNLHGLIFWGLGQLEKAHRMGLAMSRRDGCYILPYSLLSTTDTDDLLAAIEPGLVVADEAHLLRNTSAARTKRVIRYVEAKKPGFVALSGTMTKKTVMDYYALMKMGLGPLAPLPLLVGVAVDWACAIDAGVRPGNGIAVAPLVDWAVKKKLMAPEFPTIQTFRTAFRHRLRTAPGVVADNGEDDIGTSLIFKNVVLANPVGTPQWDKLEEYRLMVEEQWLTPNGDPIDHALHTWKWRWELTSGFFNRLTWPTPEALSKKGNLGTAQAEMVLARSQDHHAAWSTYLTELRRWLEDHARAGLDTPMLVGRSMAVYGARDVTSELYTFWRNAKALEFEGMIERDSDAVRVCDWKMKDGVRWAASKGHGILWFFHREVGKWLHELIPSAEYCPSGDEGSAKIAASKGKLVIGSYPGHHKGKNLQFHQNQILIESPREADLIEQTVGRLHRYKQEADELVVDTRRSTLFDRENFSAMLTEATYIHLTASPQKVLYAVHDPPPELFPGEWLQARGFQPTRLTEQQAKVLSDKFDVGKGTA